MIENFQFPENQPGPTSVPKHYDMKTTACILITAAVSFGVVQAQESETEAAPAPTPEELAAMDDELYRTYDGNGDGTITYQEYATEWVNRLKAHDANRDQGLSMEECTFEVHDLDPLALPAFEEIDVDTSGVVSIPELAAAVKTAHEQAAEAGLVEKEPFLASIISAREAEIAAAAASNTPPKGSARRGSAPQN